MDSRHFTPSLGKRLRAALLGTAATVFISMPAVANVDIANAPLFVQPRVTPAVILAVDDSGSMDSEILMTSNDGAAWWNTNRDSFVGLNQSDNPEPGVVNFNLAGGANATWKKFVYLFPNGTGLQQGRRAYADSTHDHYAVPPIGEYAFMRSNEFNFSYFDPAEDYQPWPDLGGFTFADADPDSAPTDPVLGSEVFDLRSQRERHGNNFVFQMYPGMTLPAGTRFRDWADDTWKEALTDIPITEARRVAISYFPATFYLRTTTPLPDGFGYVSNRGNVGGVLGSGAIIDGQTPDGSPMVRYEIRPENFVSTSDYEAAIQNFANWFTYYRKRHLAARGAIGVAYADIDDFRIGTYRINAIPGTASNLPIRDLGNAAERDAFFQQIYTQIGRGGTPNRQAVNHMRAQFARTDANAPIQLECQMNFGVLFTDGYANTFNAGVGNRDGDMGPPFADSVSNTMADIAAALYLDNPRPDLPAGRVPVPDACNAASPHPSLDCNRDLHVNLFGVTMGTPGTIFNVDMAATADPYTNPPTWPTSFPQRNPAHVDDLWHATLNSRGTLLDVSIPSELGVRFRQIMEELRQRVETSGTSAATSSAVLQTDTLLYAASFRSSDWSGTLTAREVNTDGSAGALVWNAETLLGSRSPADRTLLTRRSDTGAMVALEFSNLAVAQRDALDKNTADVADGRGTDRVNWLRGEEGLPGLRDRSATGTPRLIGDIVSSNPQYAGKTNFGYQLLPGAEGVSYGAFRASATYVNRPDVIYVAANSGFLHAFNAESGEEMFAYIPSELLLPEPGRDHAVVSRLMEPEPSYRYLNDGTPTIRDAYLSGQWRTVLVGTMGAGGRTVYALDVTDPENPDLLWEFVHPELGYRVSQPSIARLRDGSWAAIFGNGYNSASHQSSVFVVDLENGNLIQRLETGEGSGAIPNGMGSVAVTDFPFSDLQAARLYAGDLLGNIWVFDVSSPISSDWTTAAAIRRLYTATDSGGAPQPVTARPALALLPGSASTVVVSFGTGSYFRNIDGMVGGAQTQTLYGIFDTGATVAGRSALLEQTIVEQRSESFTTPAGSEPYDLRVVSDNLIDLSIHSGWYLDLEYGGSNQGERVISQGTFPSGRTAERIRFTTLIPDNDPCGSGRRGYLMDVDLFTGGRFDAPVFDLTGDGLLDDDDLLDGLPPSGIAFGTGELPTTIRRRGTNLEGIYTGEGENIDGRTGDILEGRQSWRQLQ